MKYRVIYGKTSPAWGQEFATITEVLKFVRKRLRIGDIIFKIENVKED